ncbi:SAM-dependent methyltransferase [Spirillospora sp. NPDC048911]|uniref:SAM-dependent methyltransferase n=1 Tax=Spirillospora sp. NPDC048911 TaxID=3364527 RepID=UPI00371B8AF2
MTDEDWKPVGIDTTTPNAARMYDFFLGGKDNFPADRAAAEKILEFVPEVHHVVRQNRAFLARAVRHLAENGIRQFIDVGTGLPTQNNVHEVAQAFAPDSRVVYVDNDPVVLAHARALLTGEGTGEVAVVEGDLRDPEKIMSDPTVHSMIDFDEPVAVLLLAVLHFIPTEPADLVRRLCEPLGPGSYLVITHATPQDSRLEDVPKVMDVYNSSTAPVTLRDHDEILPFFDDFDLVDPGLVYVSQWHTDPDRVPSGPDRSRAYGGVARRPV